MQSSVELLRDPASVGVLAHPARVRILAAVRDPETAAGVARTLGRSRQYVSYHLKELERVGLVERVGERRKGSFVEQLYRACARRFVVSSQFATDPERLESVLRDQAALAQLAELGERLQRDSAALIDLAASEGRQIPSASLVAEARFPDETARAAFMVELVDAVKTLLTKHGTADGEPYRVALAAYPELEEE
jgi:DNA-binding transcriptional ArsR family regulator